MKRTVLNFSCLIWSLGLMAQANPPITPYWALGHIVWEDSLITQSGTLQLVDGYLEHKIPVNGVIIDSPWSTAYNDFNWDPDRFSDPNSMLLTLWDRGVRPILWTTGSVNITGKDVPVDSCETFQYVIDHQYAINDGEVTRWWKGNGVHIDFTNEEAKQWWFTQIDKAFDNMYGLKVDQSEAYYGDPVKTSIGSMPNKDFRKYYYNAMYDYVTSRNPEGIIVARPYSYQATETSASIEKMSLGWCGDFQGDYAGLIKQLKDIYQSAILGYGAVGCEIGGFYGARATKKQLIRYAQFGAMTAAMINGGGNGAFTNHIPWYHDEECYNAYLKVVNLHTALMPYIFSTLVESNRYGGTLLQQCDKTSFSHRLGNDVFYKAIVSDEDEISVTLPVDDDWIDFWGGQRYQGGDVIKRTYPLDESPLFIRSGAIIPVNITNDVLGFGDATMTDRKCFLIYPKGKSEKVVFIPMSMGTDYAQASISVDEEETTINLNSTNMLDFTFLVWDAKSKEYRRFDQSGTIINLNYSDNTVGIDTNVLIDGESNLVEYYNFNGYRLNERSGGGIVIERIHSQNGVKSKKVIGK